MSNIAQQKKIVEQLRVECQVQRIPVSQSISEMMAFIDQRKDQDPLLTGIDNKQNPFKEKGGCTII